MIDTQEGSGGATPNLLRAPRVARERTAATRKGVRRWLLVGSLVGGVVVAAAIVIAISMGGNGQVVLDRRADYGLRHPGFEVSVPAAPSADDLRGDYGLRHPGFEVGTSRIDFTQDYGLRHPGYLADASVSDADAAG
jgi:hypothetical protein